MRMFGRSGSPAPECPRHHRGLPIVLAQSLFLALSPLGRHETVRAEPLGSDSFVVPLFTISGNGQEAQKSTSFEALGCLDPAGVSVHISPSFHALAGFCTQLHWLLSGAVPIDQGAKPVPTAFAAPAPNPATGAAFLAYTIQDGDVGSVRVFDLGGRLVRTLVDRAVGPVQQILRWDLDDGAGKPVAAGVYFVRLQTRSLSATRRLVVLGR